MPPCHGGDRRFESGRARQNCTYRTVSKEAVFCCPATMTKDIINRSSRVEDRPIGPQYMEAALLSVTVQGGDISSVRADALVTAVNSSGMWFGGIDGVIRRTAGNMFHGQLAHKPLGDGEAIYAPAPSGHDGGFRDVVFVVDDLRQPLRKVVLAGLSCAEQEKLSLISLPALRTGVMAVKYEKTIEEALDETVEAIRIFEDMQPSYVRRIQLVVFQNQEIEEYLAKKLSERL